MAKATRAQEVSTGDSTSFTKHELSDPKPPVVVTRAVLGGELLSVGSNSEASSGSNRKPSDETTQAPQAPAPTMASHSPQRETETDSDATSTVGVGLSSPAKQSSKPAKKTTAKKASPRQARVRSTDSDADEFDEFE